jgi:YesN/AraC family two-component response regulator
MMVVKCGYFHQLESIINNKVSLKDLISQTISCLKINSSEYSIVNFKEYMEATIIIERTDLSEKDLSFFIKSLFTNLHENLGYYTTISSHSDPVEGTELYDLHKKLKYKLIKKLVIGLDQQIDINEFVEFEESKFILSEEDERVLTMQMMNGLSGEVSITLNKLFKKWEYKNYPLYGIEKMLTQILTIAEKTQSRTNKTDSLSLSQRLNDIIALSTSFEELNNRFIEVLKEVFVNINYSNSIKLKQMVSSVERYVKMHLSDDLSLQHICHIFGISQPYLSRVFRQELDCSFNEYVINNRIEFAKNLIKRENGMLLKEIAALVGYGDSHYFSRIFKKVTGMSPSEYAESIHN